MYTKSVPHVHIYQACDRSWLLWCGVCITVSQSAISIRYFLIKLEWGSLLHKMQVYVFAAQIKPNNSYIYCRFPQCSSPYWCFGHKTKTFSAPDSGNTWPKGSHMTLRSAWHNAWYCIQVFQSTHVINSLWHTQKEREYFHRQTKVHLFVHLDHSLMQFRENIAAQVFWEYEAWDWRVVLFIWISSHYLCHSRYKLFKEKKAGV